MKLFCKHKWEMRRSYQQPVRGLCCSIVGVLIALIVQLLDLVIKTAVVTLVVLQILRWMGVIHV